MSYSCKIEDSRFGLKVENLEKVAKKLIASSYGNTAAKYFSWNKEVIEKELKDKDALCQIIQELFSMANYGIDGDKDGNILNLFKSPSSYDKDEEFFAIFAEYVEKDSYILFSRSDNGDVWRIYFDGEKCYKQNGALVFEEFSPEVEIDLKTKEFHCPKCNKIVSFEDNFCSKCEQKVNLQGFTKELIRLGYKQNLIELKMSPYNDGIVCYIGDEWLYFGGHEAESMSVEDYKKAFDVETIVDDIFAVLENFRRSGEGYTESYLNCYRYVKEHLGKTIPMDVLPVKEDKYLVAFKQPNGKYELEYIPFSNGKWDLGNNNAIGWYDEEDWDELYDAELSCDHEIVGASGGGIKCTKCSGWFAF